MFKMWHTVKETPRHLYQEHKLLRKRRAMAKQVELEPTEAYHAVWLNGGEFRKMRGPKV
jgi:protein gp37